MHYNEKQRIHYAWIRQLGVIVFPRICARLMPVRFVILTDSSTSYRIRVHDYLFFLFRRTENHRHTPEGIFRGNSAILGPSAWRVLFVRGSSIPIRVVCMHTCETDFNADQRHMMKFSGACSTTLGLEIRWDIPISTTEDLCNHWNILREKCT